MVIQFESGIGPLTRIVKSPSYGCMVEMFDENGHFVAMCNHLSHSAACELAFGAWNHGHVVDFTV